MVVLHWAGIFTVYLLLSFFCMVDFMRLRGKYYVQLELQLVTGISPKEVLVVGLQNGATRDTKRLRCPHLHASYHSSFIPMTLVDMDLSA